MEIKVGTLTAAALGSLVGLTITRPSSYTETAVALVTGLLSAYYLGADITKLIPFNERAATFLVGAFGFAIARLLNSIFIKFNSDPLAAFDRLVSSFFNRAASKEAP